MKVVFHILPFNIAPNNKLCVPTNSYYIVDCRTNVLFVFECMGDGLYVCGIYGLYLNDAMNVYRRGVLHTMCWPFVYVSILVHFIFLS